MSDSTAPTGHGDGKPASQSDATHSSRRVLVIDNEVATADFLANQLEAAGYRVEVATDGKYGLLLADSIRPQVILISTTLPTMTSHEFTQIIKNMPPYAAPLKNTRIFYLSDNSHIVSQRFNQLPEADMASYLFKPVNPEELLEKVDRTFADLEAADDSRQRTPGDM